MNGYVEQFKNAFGETRFRFWAPSVLRPGTYTKSVNCWSTKRTAEKHLKSNVAAYQRARGDRY